MIRSNLRRYLPLLLFLVTLCVLQASGLAEGEAAPAAGKEYQAATIWDTIQNHRGTMTSDASAAATCNPTT